MFVRSPNRVAWFTSVSLVFGISLLSRTAGAYQTSWKFFRGENFDGKANHVQLADHWPDRGPPLLWSCELGSGYSSFVGASGRLYTQYQTLSGQFVVCLDARSGKKIWEYRYAWPYKPASLYPGPRSTPTIAKDRLYVTTPDGALLCLDLDQGALVWKVEAAQVFNAPAPEFGYACSPVCIDGLVILPVGGPDASMVAFQQDDGSVVWRSGNEPISYCSAFPIRFAEQPLVVGYFKNAICVFDRQDGTLLAKSNVSIDYDEHSSWPLYQEPFLWSAGPFRAGCQLLKLVRPDSESNNEESSSARKLELKPIYNLKAMSNDVASSVLHEGAIYGFDLRDVQSKVHRPSRGQFICMDFLSGTVNWRNGTLARRKPVDEYVSSSESRDETDIGHASVICADGKLILLNDTGHLFLCEANRESHIPIGRTQILGGEICWTPPMLMDQCLFVRNHHQAVCVYLGPMSELKLDDDEYLFANEVIQPTYFDLSAMLLGTEPTYAMTAPKPKWLARWFLISLVLGWVAVPILAISFGRLTGFPVRALFLTLAMILGLAGTTLFGRLLSEFYFSWPIALAIMFEMLVCRLKPSKSNKATKLNPPSPWSSRLWLLAFILICLGYFYLCRRLSLAFEWAFLLGFPAAIPFLWPVKRSVQAGTNWNWLQWLLSALAFSAFYWAGASIILWKYGT